MIASGCFVLCYPDKSDDDGGVKTKKPRYSRITQQELHAQKPVLTKVWVTLVFLITSLILIPVGVVCLIYGLQAHEIVTRYDNCKMSGETDALTSNSDIQQFLWQNAGDSKALSCQIVVSIDKDMKGPLYLYYEIHGLYQNHRRYVRSHVDLQLAGQGGWQGYVNDQTQSQSCVPILNNAYGNQINPCGLVAWSLFNDTYHVKYHQRNSKQNVSSLAYVDLPATGIAFQSDITYRFANYTPQNFQPDLASWGGGGNITGTLKEDQRFQNWMRLSHMPKFRKLWAVWQDVDLVAGDTLYITVVNQYNTFSFNGQKHFVISTTNWLGGNNYTLGVTYLVAGGTSLLFALAYLMVTLIKPRKFADTSRLKRGATYKIPFAVK
ncbi:hypothetical protein CEUSTIGMA_g2720.t1 [Chlamydomonas eustigma]|uniref:ALA-interacting subunit n=1 Tax=Chlamydomonas eustigma TaxID=1157962 RepID=A0A250WWV7_9CHLO|nr:hypothetical protein CEUSTIGMA_g2720.t1 [Chlamydomonas eustigma]|eukprot:GAX75275.1 hypothetical protein CEUSTIGMA_g2720.t1 [Chlamydomonas eustigma]